MTYGAKNQPDRTVHATTLHGKQIVRYDRAGKWYLEDPPGRWRVRISLATAVCEAAQFGSYVYLGKPGGKRFDAAVRAASKARIA
jgi:hypothetical protein